MLATTGRLWAARHLHRPGSRWRLAGLIVLILAISTVAGLVITRQGVMRAPEGRQVRGSHGSPAAPGPAAVRGLAAGWMARQVGGDVTLACDPVMCAALAARGIPAANMVPVRPATAGLPSADLVVATQAVRDHLGSRLAGAYAPLVIASFGTGRAQIQLRQVAPGGAAAFWRKLSNGRSVLRQASVELLRNSRIKLSAAAKAALMAGRVDGRLLTVLAALAGRQPIRVLGFGGTNPGAAPGVPMREMLLAGAEPATHARADRHGRSLMRFLRAQPAPYHPARCSMVRQSRDSYAIRVGFAAPSPAGL